MVLHRPFEPARLTRHVAASGRYCRHSSRRVRTGSTRVARQAGNVLATIPTTTSKSATAVNVSGSVGGTPKTSDATNRLSASARFSNVAQVSEYARNGFRARGRSGQDARRGAGQAANYTCGPLP